MKDDLVHVGGRERLGDELAWIVRPRDDVDPLATQLADHRLHPASLEAHAGPHGVHVRIAGPHGDLGAAARLAGDGPNLHDALIDLRDFEREQRLDEVRMGAAEDELRPLGRLLYIQQQCAHGLALAQVLAPDLLARRHDGFRPPIEEHERVAAVDLLHRPRDELADAVLVLVADPVALLLADLLDDHLLGGLDRVAAELAEVERDLGDLARLRLAVAPRLVDVRQGLGLLDGHLAGGILELLFVLDDLLQQVDADLAGGRIDEDVRVRLSAVVPAHRGEHAGLDQLDDLALVDRLFAGELPEGVQDLHRHIRRDSCSIVSTI